MPTLGS